MIFTLDARQLEKYSEWLKTRRPADEGAIGGRYTFSFTPTGLGYGVRVYDNIQNEELDLTPYDEW